MTAGVVITGLGLCTPLGSDAPSTWRAIQRNRKAHIRKPRHGGVAFDTARDMGMAVCREALAQAGIWKLGGLVGVDAERVGCTVSVSKPFIDDSGRAAQPPERLLTELRQAFGLRGEARNLIAACATGAYAIALGAAWIEEGLCDVVLAGSVEAPLHPLFYAGFAQMGVLSSNGETRPFDQARTGFAPGAGAGVVVLERAAFARARPGRILGQLAGWGLGADGHSAVAFNSDGLRIAEVIGRALLRAELPASEVQHVNAHGTGTQLNDCIETQALIKAFGRSAPALMVSGTKGSTGHLLGACGSVEAVLTVLALQDQFIPATTTLETPDPKCPLDYTPRRGHEATFRHALSLSFGFGGPIGALLFSRGAL